MKHLLIFITASLFAQRPVVVTRVIDGDTFVAEQKTYRIAEIDAPELNQNYGRQSKAYLSRMIEGKIVQIIPIATDKYQRTIVKVYRRDLYIAEQLVGTGNAWWYGKYSKSQRIKVLQNYARLKKKGLWNYKNITNPYHYRKYHVK